MLPLCGASRFLAWLSFFCLEKLEYIKENYPKQFILFGVVIDNSTENVPENLFTQITSRFDKFLKRKYIKKDESARGLAIFDKTKMENQYQNWAKKLPNNGKPMERKTK